MFDFSLLIGKISSYNNDMNFGKLAKYIGISRSTLRSKLKGRGFNQDEIVKICQALHIDDKDIIKYFFRITVEFKKTLQH